MLLRFLFLCIEYVCLLFISLSFLNFIRYFIAIILVINLLAPLPGLYRLYNDNIYEASLLLQSRFLFILFILVAFNYSNLCVGMNTRSKKHNLFEE